MSLTIQELSVIHNTFVIERSYPYAPERVFAAFADPAKKRRWFAEGNGRDADEFEMDFRVGGTERTRSQITEGPLQGTPFKNDAIYHDIVPNRRLVMSSAMTLGDQRISASLTTFELVPTDKGTVLLFTHQGAFLEGSDGPEMREGGWRRLLQGLAGELAR